MRKRTRGGYSQRACHFQRQIEIENFIGMILQIHPDELKNSSQSIRSLPRNSFPVVVNQQIAYLTAHKVFYLYLCTH